MALSIAVISSNFVAVVKELERRREQALIPIKKLEDEAKDKLDEANAFFDDLQAQKIEITESKKELKNRESTVVNEEKKIANENTELNKREERIRVSEREIKLSLESLTEKWGLYYKESGKEKTRLSEWENKLIDREKIVEIRDKNQNDRAIELNNQDRLLRDKYGALQKAIEEARKKYKI